jgi:beta-lactamase regulating signal transducer with metallopeptidase domain
MTLIAFPASTTLLARLAVPAARALALSVIVGVGLSAFRVKNTSIRLFAWTAVLYAALVMPLLQQMLPPLPIPAPAFLEHELTKAQVVFSGTAETTPPFRSLAGAAERRQNAAHGAGVGKEVDANQPQPDERSAVTNSPKRTSTALASSLSPAIEAHSINAPHASFLAYSESSPSSIRWSAIASGIYLAVALIFFARFFIGLAFSRRLLQASCQIEDPCVTQRLAARASACSLASTPQAAESEMISVPVTMGALRSTILLPIDWREWDDAQLDAVIAHEVSHVARHDALTQRLSLLHRAIFWFSPLSWWLDRHLADLAEQASDEAALSCGADRQHYAKILVGFFEALHTAPGRVWWQGVSMAKAGQAEHRVERILAWKGSLAMRLQKSIAVVVVALAIPLVYLAASAHPAQHVSVPVAQLVQDQTPPPTSSAAAPASSQATPPPEPGPASGVTGGVTDGTTEGTAGGPVSSGPTAPPAPPAPAPGVGTTVRARIAPVAPVGPSAPVAPIAPVAPVAAIGQSESVSSSSGRGFSFHYGYDDEQRFVIVSGKTDSLTMSGSTEDAHHVEKLRKQISGDFIWFQRDEKSYVIRDQATIDRAKKLWEPQQELGKKQEALGKQQEALGKQQQELGAKIQEIRVNVPDMNADLEKLKAELKQLGSSGATVEQVGHIQSEIGELQSKIGTLQSHAGDQQGKLGEEMGALGERQGKLGEQQGELGRQQGELAEQASRQMEQLLDEAITKGTAQPEI